MFEKREQFFIRIAEMCCKMQYKTVYYIVEGGIHMAVKTANVNVRVEQNIKEQAEAILERLGISASAFINMTYRQVILQRGIPFEVKLEKTLPTRDTMTKEEFDAMMATGLAQAKAGESIGFEDAFDSLLKGL